MEWIKCSERIPEETQKLLVYSNGEVIAGFWNYVMPPIDYKKYRAFTDFGGRKLDIATHWMPFPTPPTE
ncbi:DUF551 domain-containing protein [Klebsiella aerogenes]|uniref:DUF551 domain-containing protein n=1 Tax=Klebsiella aerogenes TaxID=548 RepID=UPI0007B3CF64|nr:DUF551 domain-containing protein [Klebsiella aerogenes]KZR10456.1 hypothetical protein A3N54_05635 [Klebsiella aerogenes]